MPNAFLPIIYVRGFAMTRGEIDETTADPFCGFNLGSTMYRAVPDKASRPPQVRVRVARRASGLRVRLRDVYEDGYDILDADWDGG